MDEKTKEELVALADEMNSPLVTLEMLRRTLTGLNGLQLLTKIDDEGREYLLSKLEGKKATLFWVVNVLKALSAQCNQIIVGLCDENQIPAMIKTGQDLAKANESLESMGLTDVHHLALAASTMLSQLLGTVMQFGVTGILNRVTYEPGMHRDVLAALASFPIQNTLKHRNDDGTESVDALNYCYFIPEDVLDPNQCTCPRCVQMQFDEAGVKVVDLKSAPAKKSKLH